MKCSADSHCKQDTGSNIYYEGGYMPPSGRTHGTCGPPPSSEASWIEESEASGALPLQIQVLGLVIVSPYSPRLLQGKITLIEASVLDEGYGRWRQLQFEPPRRLTAHTHTQRAHTRSRTNHKQKKPPSASRH